MRNTRFLAVAAVAAAAALPFLIADRDAAQAHASCTSRFTYNENVFPILRDRCGSCHITGGAAPITLLTYKDATQWASAMRDELTTERMPPWHVDPVSPPVQHSNPITASEINMVIDWGACNTPHGNLAATLPTLKYTPEWKLGEPDLKLQMPEAHTVGADVRDETINVSIPTGTSEVRWVKAVDLMPNAIAMVRDAVISVDNGPVLALWEPGNDPVAAPAGTAFKLAGGANIHLQIHYKKNYLDESKAISDRSTIGLYFTSAPAAGHELQAVNVAPTDENASAPRTFTQPLPSAARIVALRPMLDQPYSSVVVNAVGANGQRTPLLDLQDAWPQWFRRYWLQNPIAVPAGATLEVRVTPRPVDPTEPRPAKRFPLDVGVDYIPQ